MQSPAIKPAWALSQRELVRFFRQRHRVIGALATPIVFWLLIGAGMGRSFRAEGLSGGYMEYFFPGTVLMVVLFTAIFSTISIIEDRREGFLQSVLVAPVSRSTIVLGKVLGGTLLATAQGAVLLPVAPLVGIELSVSSVALALFMLLVLSFALTSLGVCVAWPMSSTQGFHAIMNLVIMPLWFLSGALFPSSGAWSGIRMVMILNPLSYGMGGLRHAMYRGDDPSHTIASLPVCVGVSVGFAAVMFIAATLVASRRQSDHA